MRPDCSCAHFGAREGGSVPFNPEDYSGLFRGICFHFGSLRNQAVPLGREERAPSDAGGAAARVFVCVPFRWGISRSVCWCFG